MPICDLFALIFETIILEFSPTLINLSPIFLKKASLIIILDPEKSIASLPILLKLTCSIWPSLKSTSIASEKLSENITSLSLIDDLKKLIASSE